MMQSKPKLLLMLTACLLLLAGATAFGQRQITGKVTDEALGEGLPGATVKVVGTTVGTVTDFDGNFKIAVPDGSTELSVSYTGFQTQTVAIGASNVIDFSMKESTLLQEVVVIGYGTVTRKDATGAVSTVNSDKFNKGAVTTAQELVTGKISGVQITPNAEGGGGGTIRIRGGSSLSADNDPLIVLDGVPIANGTVSGDRNPLSFINPNDIETMTVLKDASATAIYGSRASNGVILITTKKGSLSQKGALTFSAGVAFSDRLQQVDVLDAAAYKSLIESRYAVGHPARALLGNSNTNWQDQIYRQGVAQDYGLEYAGGAGKLPFRASLQWTDRDNILKTDGFQRTSAAVNLSPQFFNNTLQFNINAKHSRTKNRFGNRGAIGSAVSFDPTKPVYDVESPYGGYFTWLDPSGNGNPNVIATANPLAQIELKDDRGDVGRFIGSFSADYRFWFLKDLRANLNLGYDRSDTEGWVTESDQLSSAFVNKGLSKTYNQVKRNRLLEYYMTYGKKLGGKSSFDVMAGYSWQHFYIYDNDESRNLAGTVITEPYDDDIRQYFLLSTFGRANINLFDRVLLTGSVRRDGSSRFSENTRYGLFPAGAVGINVISRDKGVFNQLKLRASYGETGQQEVSTNFYPYLPTYLASQSTAQYQLGNQFVTTLRPDEYDANLKWETTATSNVGLDYGFFDSRINGSVEYYIRKTSDLIGFIPVAAGTNLSNFITTNVGSMENKGVEFSLNLIPIRTNKATWEIGGNVTLNKNKVTKLNATSDPKFRVANTTDGISGGVGNYILYNSVGNPANSFYVYEQVYDDKGVPIEGVYVDRNQDGRISPEDKYDFKNRAPRMFFGFYTSYNRKHWDFSAGARMNLGNYVYNNIQSENGQYNRLYASSGFLSNLATSGTEVDFAVPQYFSDHFVQDASFFRIDHITLGYRFGKIGKFNAMRLFATVQNPVLVTKYIGLDPEIFSGVDNNAYPRSRTIQFGLSATL